jgi:alpha-methylacyl-CoA racemase
MMLADLGADVVRIARPGGAGGFELAAADETLHRGKRIVELDLSARADVERVLALIALAHVVTEGFRPGVAERLGVGPADCQRVNPGIVYGRMTGWGQDGPLAGRAGHDINYIALSGALHAIGSAGSGPQVPLNLLGDFGGGGMYLVVGVLAALHAGERTGRGEVVDAAIVDGAAHLLAAIHGLLNAGAWVDERGANLLDGGAPFYRTYETSDHRRVAVGAIEPNFFACLVETLQLDVDVTTQFDRTTWPATRRALAAAFSRRSQAEWTETFEGIDACVSPVLSLHQAADHPHLSARAAIFRRDGHLQPSRAPRFANAPRVGVPAPSSIGCAEDIVAGWSRGARY